MSYNRFSEIKLLIPLMMEGENTGKDDWWKVRGMLDDFNMTRKHLLNISKVAVLDERMSGFWPR